MILIQVMLLFLFLNCILQALNFHFIAYPLLTHLPLQISNIFSPSSTGPGLPTPFSHAGNPPPLYIYLENLSTLQPPIVQFPAHLTLTFCISKHFEHLVLNRLCYYLESKNLIFPTQDGFQPDRSTIDQVFLLSKSIWDGFQRKRPTDQTVLANIDFS